MGGALEVGDEDPWVLSLGLFVWLTCFSVFLIDLLFSCSFGHNLLATPYTTTTTITKSGRLLLLPSNLNFTVLFRSYKEDVT